MDSSRDLVVAVLKGGKGALRLAQEKIQPNFLSGDGLLAYEYVCDYVKTYNDLPTMELVQQKTGIPLDLAAPLGTVEFCIDEVVKGHLQGALKKALTSTTKLLEGFQPHEALTLLENEIKQLRATQLTGSKIVTLGSLGQEVIDRYLLVESGARGILAPWDLMNDVTLGLWPKDLALFVARVGIGKTWTAAMLALHAWKSNKRVLFATTEMGPGRIAQRIFALHLKLNYTNLTHGKLGAFIKQNFIDGVKALQHDDRFHVVGGDFDFKVENFEAAIDQTQPDLVLLDGAYLLRVQGNNRIERAANAFDELKRICNRTNVPIAVTMQFNREVKANQADSVKTESIALTDVASWNADLIYGLIQTEDMKAEKRLIFKSLKAREGQGIDFECNWNLDTMDFSQIGPWKKEGAPGGGDADEHGVGHGTAFSGGGTKPPDDLPF